MTIEPWVKPGQMLAFARELKQRGAWPPTRPIQQPSRDRRPATAYVVVPALAGDKGARPLADTAWLNSAALRLINVATQRAEDHPRKGQTYRIAAAIENHGDAPVLGGFAEFFVADPIWIDNALGFHVGNPENARPAWLGVTPFSIDINKAQIVQSRKTWTPSTDMDLARTLLVRAYDPLADRAGTDWDSWADRHVGRRDLAPSFAGHWTGTETIRPLGGSGTATIRITDIPGMKAKTPFGPNGSYPGGDFECNVTVEALAPALGRALSLAPVTDVQYIRGTLGWTMYSTNSADANATRADFNLTQQADGHLRMTCRWGPHQLAQAVGASQAILQRV